MQQSSHVHDQNSNAKHLIRYSILAGVVLISLFVYVQRYTIFFHIGNTAFGETIAGHTFYNLSVAENFLTKANTAQKPREWTNYQLSRINFIKGDLQRAVFFADNELKLYPDNCRTHYIRGLSYGYMERLDDAISDFEIFNTCFPNTWAGHNDLAWFWFRKGDMNKVISIAEEAFKNNSTNATSPWLQNTYGTALMNVGRYLEADNALRMAQYLAGNMTEQDWGKAYPGNDPLIYGKGLESMRTTINNNLLILKGKMNTVTVTPVTIHR